MIRVVSSILIVLVSAFVATVYQSPVDASSLKISPLEYRTSLSNGESQKGFIDVSNPTGATLDIETEVKAFRQIDDSGSLEFYDSDQIEAGVRLDLDSFQLGPREALRMYFSVDGTKLPSGNVFAAIFFKGTVGQSVGIAQSTNVGTILSIENGTPTDQRAKVTTLDVPLFVLGNEVTGAYRIKNTADPKKSTGFYPGVTITAAPFGDEISKQSSLVFAGRERANSFVVGGSLSPILFVTVKTPTSSQTRPVITMSAPILLIILILMSVVFVRVRYGKRRPRKRRMNRR